MAPRKFKITYVAHITYVFLSLCLCICCCSGWTQFQAGQAPPPGSSLAHPGESTCHCFSLRRPRERGNLKQCLVPTVTSCPNLPTKSTQRWPTTHSNRSNDNKLTNSQSGPFTSAQLLGIRHLFLTLTKTHLSRGLIDPLFWRKLGYLLIRTA